MGTSTKYIYTKQANILTIDHFVANGNAIFEAIVEAGMVQVDYAVISGQTDKFVSGTIVNPNDKVVVLDYPSFSGSAGSALKGFKVFRHPILNFYIKVGIYETGIAANNCTALVINIEYAQNIDSNGNLTKSVTIRPRSGEMRGWPAQGSMGGTGYVSGKQLTFRVSMAADHFVMSATPDLNTYESGQAYAQGTTLSQANINPRGGYSTMSFAVFKSSNTKYNFIFAPRNLTVNGSYPNEVTLTAYSVIEQGLQRKWLVDTLTGNTLYLGAAQTVSAVSEIGTVSDVNGVRVEQLVTTVDGERVTLPVGCIHGGAVADMDIVTLNLDGHGDRQYFCSYGFGPTNWLSANYLIEKVPFMLLPWGD